MFMDEIVTPKNYSLPIFAINSSNDFPISFMGSCFPICYQGRIWIITAKHILTNHGYRADQIAVPVKANCSEYFQFVEAATHDIPDAPDLADVVIFRVDSATTALSQDNTRDIFDFDNESADATKETFFAIHGFPNELNAVDYDDGTSTRQGIILETTSPQESEFAGCGSIDLLRNGQLSDANGFSGGPVFEMDRETMKPTRLLGVLVRGSTSRMHFARTDVIRSLISTVLTSQLKVSSANTSC